jgi:hypothetical protein
MSTPTNSSLQTNSSSLLHVQAHTMTKKRTAHRCSDEKTNKSKQKGRQKALNESSIRHDEHLQGNDEQLQGDDKQYSLSLCKQQNSPTTGTQQNTMSTYKPLTDLELTVQNVARTRNSFHS